MGFLRRLNRNQQGLTAIELAVVVAILAILAAIVAGNTTGMSTGARGATKNTDISEVQKAVDSFKGQNPNSYYPVNPLAATLSANTAINFTAIYTTPEGTVKSFVPDFLQRKAKHADDATTSWYIQSNGQVTNTLSDAEY